MANLHRGEIDAVLSGKAYTLCLTLGALAQLEAQLECEDILALARRFESGRITAREAICVIGAGLRGAGNDITNENVASMQMDGGVPKYLSLVIDLLQAAFGAQEKPDSTGREVGGESHAPFPGGV